MRNVLIGNDLSQILYLSDARWICKRDNQEPNFWGLLWFNHSHSLSITWICILDIFIRNCKIALSGLEESIQYCCCLVIFHNSTATVQLQENENKKEESERYDCSAEMSRAMQWAERELKKGRDRQRYSKLPIRLGYHSHIKKKFTILLLYVYTSTHRTRDRSSIVDKGSSIYTILVISAYYNAKVGEILSVVTILTIWYSERTAM